MPAKHRGAPSAPEPVTAAGRAQRGETFVGAGVRHGGAGDQGIREPDGHVTGDPADESRGRAGPCGTVRDPVFPPAPFRPRVEWLFVPSVVNDHSVAQDTLFDSPLPCEVGSRLRAFRRCL